MSPGTFEYVVRNILIHLDDQNENLRVALFRVLQTAARIRPKLVLREVILFNLKINILINPPRQEHQFQNKIILNFVQSW